MAKFDELDKLDGKLDELDKLRMSSMSWISCTVSSDELAKLRKFDE